MASRLFSEDFASYMEGKGSTSKHSDKETVIVKDMTNKSNKEPVLKGKVGRKPLVEEFPTLIGTATNFIKLHCYSAHARCRISSGSGTGVSVEDVRRHLLQSVPGLAVCISATTVAYLFCPPSKVRNASKRYKSFIAARVPAKRNNVRKKNVDVHYLFSRVKMRREFAERFKNEVITVSCDDMNKLNVGGGMVVSR